MSETEEDFDESNYRLATAFEDQLEDMLDDLIDRDEQCGFRAKNPAFLQIGEWHRLEVLARHPGGDEFLTAEDSRLLRESFKVQIKSGVPDLDVPTLDSLQYWINADIEERWFAFCFYVCARISAGVPTEEESVLLFALANRALGYLDLSGTPSEKETLRSLAKKGADALHKKKGFREKKATLRAIWASGKYDTRDICAEEEYAALGMSFATARKALQNTPDPTR